MFVVRIPIPILFFFLGASLASFLNVVAGGSGDLQKNLKRKHSRCDSCKRDLLWWELIPIFSWLALRGRCAKCGQKIPFFHPVSELLLGLALSAGVVVTYSSAGLFSAVVAGIYILIMYYFSVYDLFHQKVPNRYLYPVIVASSAVIAVQASLSGDIRILLNAFLGAGIAFIFFAGVNVLSVNGFFPGVKKGKEGFGWGDAKYGIFLGLILGWPAVGAAVWIGILSGAVFGIGFLIVTRKRNTAIPFIPFLSFGAWVAMSWGHAIIDRAVKYLTY